MATDLPQVCRTALSGTFNGEKFVNVIHFYKNDDSDMTAADLTAIHGLLDNATSDPLAWSNLIAFMDSGAVVDTITSTTLDNQTPVQKISSVSLAGTSGGTDLPPMLALVTKWTTAISTRRTRGRTYLPGVNSGMIAADSDRFDSSFVNSLAVVAQEFADAWLAHATYSFVILSETARDEDELVPFHEVVGASVNPLVCVQRRRRQRP